jgi:hypothetical protein
VSVRIEIDADRIKRNASGDERLSWAVYKVVDADGTVHAASAVKVINGETEFSYDPETGSVWLEASGLVRYVRNGDVHYVDGA